MYFIRILALCLIILKTDYYTKQTYSTDLTCISKVSLLFIPKVLESDISMTVWLLSFALIQLTAAANTPLNTTLLL